MIELSSANENAEVMKNHHFNENSKMRWKFITGMNLDPPDDISLMWWKCISLIKAHKCDENLSPKWKLIDSIKTHWFDEKSSMWYNHIAENFKLW